jgi:hypothetical protein
VPFTYTTLAAARQQLANRLYDPNMVFWTSAELTLYVQEALSTFNAFAQYWRGDFQFPTATTTTWYDLTRVANTLRPFTVTDVDLYTIMEYHLLEPPTGAIWNGTAMFTINDLFKAVQRRRDEILGNTGCTITRSVQNSSTGTIRNFLSDSIIDVRRIAWIPTQVPFFISGNTSNTDTLVTNVTSTVTLVIGQPISGSGIPANTTIAGLGLNSLTLSNPATSTAANVSLSVTPFPEATPLWPEDTWSFQSYEPEYGVQQQGVPSSFSLSAQPPLSFDVDIPPQQEGQYELLTVNAGTDLTPVIPTIMPIPNDFAWVLKWGALADLFSKEAEAKDTMRAQYCNMRYQQGMQLLTMSPAVLEVRVNNVPVWTDAVRSADEFQTDWQAQTPGQPVSAFVAGLNLIALSPQPDSTAYSVSVSVVENAPLPVENDDFLQVARDDYDVILDYAQHLALVKCGGEEFIRTKPLFDRLVRQAALYNSKLAESGMFQDAIYGSSQLEETMNPRMKKPASATAGVPDQTN